MATLSEAVAMLDLPTAEDVADLLRAHEVQGRPTCPCCCPVATLITHEIIEWWDDGDERGFYLVAECRCGQEISAHHSDGLREAIAQHMERDDALRAAMDDGDLDLDWRAPDGSIVVANSDEPTDTLTELCVGESFGLTSFIGAERVGGAA